MPASDRGAGALAPRLLPWFDRERRDLPWRRTQDPYRIWVAEVMLQQTQVATVIPFYERWLEHFPDVRSLAVAPLDEVLQLWAGLGYYARARNLHRAAGVIVAQHGGAFPTQLQDALALPGIGRYTAGAILSIACGQRLPAIDGNAARVLARVLFVRGDVRSGQPRRRVEELGAQAVAAERPGDYNQALMELGSTVCLPRNPRCEACPLGELCEARRRGWQDSIPPPRTAAMRGVSRVAAIMRRRGRVLIAQRPPEGVWGGLCEFPNVECDGDRRAGAALVRYLREAFGVEVEVGESVARVRYGIMDQRVNLSVSCCTMVRGRTRAREHDRTRWVRPQELANYALPAPHRKIADGLAADADRS